MIGLELTLSAQLLWTLLQIEASDRKRGELQFLLPISSLHVSNQILFIEKTIPISLTVAFILPPFSQLSFTWGRNSIGTRNRHPVRTSVYCIWVAPFLERAPLHVASLDASDFYEGSPEPNNRHPILSVQTVRFQTAWRMGKACMLQRLNSDFYRSSKGGGNFFLGRDQIFCWSFWVEEKMASVIFSVAYHKKWHRAPPNERLGRIQRLLPLRSLWAIVEETLPRLLERR